VNIDNTTVDITTHTYVIENNQPLGEKLIKETKYFTFITKHTHLVFGL